VDKVNVEVNKDELWKFTLDDSGHRREFSTGAVRDMRECKGRCDLMPLDVIGKWMDNLTLKYINNFIETGDNEYLFTALQYEIAPAELPKYALELSKHFEAGAIKYGERNWEKGIPLSSYIDSAVRHYLKYLDGQENENHFIAFVWNIICAIWTNNNLPEMRDLPYEQENI
jgi:hypothetical protein